MPTTMTLRSPFRRRTTSYNDSKGQLNSIDLPNLLPGQSHTFILRNANSSFNFEIMRNDGSSVLTY